QVRAVLSVLLDQHLAILGWERANLHPVSDALAIKNGAGIGVLDKRVVKTQLFDDLAVARRAAIDCDHAEERPMLAAQLFHANSDCHTKPHFVVSCQLPRTPWSLFFLLQFFLALLAELGFF